MEDIICSCCGGKKATKISKNEYRCEYCGNIIKQESSTRDLVHVDMIQEPVQTTINVEDKTEKQQIEIVSMTFSKAVSICFKQKYTTFTGRATRSEYWLFNAFTVILAIGLSLFSYFAGYATTYDVYTATGISQFCVIVYLLVLFCPSLAVTIRRLHDTGRSGWWCLISFIPYVGNIILLVFMCLGSEQKNNRYGSIPLC